MLAWFIALWVGWDCFCLGDWDLLFACSLPILLFYSVYWGLWVGGCLWWNKYCCKYMQGFSVV